VPTPTSTAALATAVTASAVTASATPAISANLSLYTNSKHGFTFQYPNGLVLNEDAGKDFLFLDDQIFIQVMDHDPQDARGDGPVVESTEAVQIGSFAARRMRGYIGSVGGGIPQRYESIVIPQKGKFYIFIAYELKRNVNLPLDRQLGPVPPNILNLLNQIVSTLRFTN
jgi:hypothetical protein